jgi:DNA-binding transcriptional regulator of glucitol operon
MKRSWVSLLHPKWWVLHVFTVAAMIAMLYLGRWQWHVAHRHHGDIRYYAYAFQWWAFSFFAAMMWLRIVLDYLRGGREPLESAEITAESQPGAGYRAYVPPVPAEPEQDAEQARFNAYLRALQSESEGRE